MAASNKTIVAWINRHSSIPIRDVRMVLHMLTAFVTAKLCRGEDVNIWELGTWRLKKRTGRTVTLRQPHSKKRYHTVQPDSWYAQWKASTKLRKKVRDANRTNQPSKKTG